MISVSLTASTPQSDLGATRTQLAFERIKSLSGEWRSSSTKGWTGTSFYRVIARGSAVLYTSDFDDAPESGMATVFFMDGNKLKVTHYCESRTQPTLVASKISVDNQTIEFVFDSGTSLPSRDKGHMDRLIMHFKDAAHYTAKWTWYQNGKERWMEEITYELITGAHTSDGT